MHNINVRNYYKGKHSKLLEKRITNLLKKVPLMYLRGIHSIVILNTIAIRQRKNAAGIYIRETKLAPARIELAIDNIFQDMPSVFYYFPFLSRFLLARVLFHEIGHHYQLSKAGLKKKDWETDAEKFSTEMLKRTFPYWRITLMSIKPMIRYLRDRENRISKNIK